MIYWGVFLSCAAGSFLLGSIPFGLLVGRLQGMDVRKIGSGNTGAMNVGRILGRKWFFVVFGLDLLKGLIPTLVGGLLLGSIAPGEAPETTRMICRLIVGLTSILGHNYSPFLGFRGGKGVSTSLGVALGVYPDLTLPALFSFVIWVIGFGLTRMSSFGSLSGGVLFPMFYLLALRVRGESVSDHWPFAAFTVVVAVLVVVRHRANIARIMAGTETRVGKAGKHGGSLQTHSGQK